MNGFSKWLWPVVVLLILAVGVFVYLMVQTKADVNVIFVPHTYPTLSQALANAAPGSVIQIDSKNSPYLLNVTINTNRVWIRSASEQAVLQPQNSDQPIVDIQAEGVRISGFQFEQGNVCARAQDSLDLRLENNTFLNCDIGLLLETSKQAAVVDNHFEQNRTGVSVRLSQAVAIENNQIDNNIEYGVRLQGSNQIQIVRNRITNNYVGLEDRAGNSNTFTENTVENNQFEGVLWIETNQSSVRDNRFASNYDGVSLQESTQMEVEDNACERHQGAGIRVSGGSDNTLTGNDCQHNAHGIVLIRAHRNKLEANQLHNNAESGVYLQASIQNVLIANHATHNQYGLSLQGADQNAATNNRLSENLVGARLSTAQGNALSFNQATDNQTGIEIGFSSNNVFKSNLLQRNAAGMLVTESQANDVIANAFHDNGYGVGLIYSERNNLFYNTFRANAQTAISLLNLSRNNQLVENQLRENTYGIVLASASGNLIERNVIRQSQVGLTLQLSGENTRIKSNTFSDNQIALRLPEFVDKTDTLLRGTDVPLEILGSNEGYLVEQNHFINNQTMDVQNQQDATLFALSNRWGGQAEMSSPTDAHYEGAVETRVPRLRGPLFLSSYADVEQQLLGALTKRLLQAHGFAVVDMTNLGTEFSVREALLGGIVDLAWWHSFWEDHPRLGFSTEKNDTAQMIWMDCSAAQTQLGLAFGQTGFGSPDDESEKTVSQWVDSNQNRTVTIAMPQAFTQDAAGLGAFVETYGLDPQRTKTVLLNEDEAVVALSLGDVDAAFLPRSTAAQDVFNVSFFLDDKQFFEPGSPCPVARQEVVQLFPEIEPILNELAEALEDGDLRTLKGKVQFFGESFETVAQDYLQQRGLIAGNN